MKENSKNILTVILSAAVILGLCVLSITLPPASYSESERRPLSQKPKPSENDILSGKYMENFESYTLDQFPFRDSFRKIKAFSALYIFSKKDNNGLYFSDGHISKLEYPLNVEKLDRNIKKLNEIYRSFLSGTECRLYFSVVPDKNYFLANRNGYPALDYSTLVKKMKNELSFAEYIDIFGSLSIDDYYKTDPHWKQENILSAAETIAGFLGADILSDYTENVSDKPFYGAYSGQFALDSAPDSIKYLTNEITENCAVTSYNSGKPIAVPFYDLEKMRGKDPYEMYLNGSDAFIVIENPLAKTDRELVIFRDSFGSSLAPLLIPDYSKTVLIDLRYMKSELIENYVSFKDQDVLFIYSTLVLNNTISQ